MTSAVVSNFDEIRELTIDELDQAGGGMFPPGPTVVDQDAVFNVTPTIGWQIHYHDS